MTNLVLKPKANMNRVFDSIFDDIISAPVFGNNVSSCYAPRVNVEDTKDHLIFKFEVAGMNKDDIKVQVKDNVLNVSGKREFEKESKDGDYVISEIKSGSFCRSFTLPETVNLDKVSADYKNGMLEIKMDKLEEVKPKEIEIKVS